MSGKALMNDIGESYSGVVPEKQPNKGGRPSAEDPEGAPEGRPLAKENTEQSNQCRTQRRENGPNGLERVREVAKKDGKVRFTALLHHVTVDLLRDSYHSLKKKAAPGVLSLNSRLGPSGEEPFESLMPESRNRHKNVCDCSACSVDIRLYLRAVVSSSELTLQ
jgi:hypothetical protein